jgi:alginate O-acetyltransferase complex protein AlgJ
MATEPRSTTAPASDPPRLHRAWERALIAIFLLVIAIPPLATLAGVDRTAIEGENRRLAPFPRLAFDREALTAFPDAFTRYFEDHFAFRARLVEWQGRARLRYLRSSPQPTVITGKSGWLFYADDGSMDDYISARPFNAQELDVWRTTLQDTQDWLQRQGITYLFVLAPDKHAIYQEMMPDDIRRLHREWRYDRLAQHLRQHSNVHVLDLGPVLIGAKARERLFHLTDTHWNDRGAYVAYEEIMYRLNAMRPGLRPWPRSAFDARVATTGGRDLAGMLGLAGAMTEEDLLMTPRLPRCARMVEENVPNSNGSAARYVTECDKPGLPRAVIYRDSFATALIPFLSEHFSRAVYLWERDVNPAVIAEERPDVVIHEWVGRHLATKTPYDAFASMRTARSQPAGTRSQ